MSAAARPNAGPGLWQRLRALAGARPPESADVLPVRVGGTEYRRTTATPAHVLGFDQALCWVVLLLLAFSVVMVYSASIAMPDNPRFGNIAPHHFVLRHAIAIGVGFVGALLAFQVSMNTWERMAPWLFVVSILLLIAVLIPHVGVVVNGARRWLSLGIMNFQPSELAKFAVLIYAADYMVRKMEVKERFFRAVLPMVVAVGVVGALLLAEPDMGAFMVIAVIAMGILFLGGVNARMFFLIAAVLVAAFAMMVMTSPWRRERIFAYLDPFSEAHALGKGYQLSHSLIAIGRGEIFGVGLGGSVEKLHWLPEAHTDFLLAVIGEEFGLVGVLVLLPLYLLLIMRGLWIASHAQTTFGRVMAGGLMLILFVYVFVNIGMVSGILPVVGVPLPLVSYGGSALIVLMAGFGIVTSIHTHRKLLSKNL